MAVTNATLSGSSGKWVGKAEKKENIVEQTRTKWQQACLYFSTSMHLPCDRKKRSLLETVEEYNFVS